MITIDIVFLFQAVNFLLLLFLLNILLYKPIRKVMADRAAEMSASREKAASVDLEVQEKMHRYEQKLREIKAAASEERNRLIGEARSEEARIVGAARDEASQSMTALQGAIRKEAEEAETFLRAQAETLSRVISEKVLGRSLS
jgi:F-type H+-transporting ATPase subunit b